MATKKKAPVVDEVEDLELEDLDETEAEDEAEAKSKKTSKKAADAPKYGVPWLCQLLSEKFGKTVTPRELRAQLRRMARDNSGRIEREISPDNRNRYSWTGPKDPEVLAVIAAYEGGEPDEAKAKALADLKKRGEAKKAKKRAEKEKAEKAKSKKAKAAEADDEDDDFEVDED